MLLYDSNSCYDISGGTKAQRNFIIAPLLWAKSQLIPRHSVTVDIKLRNLGEEYLGFCQYEDDNYLRPRSFVIELNKKFDNETMLMTLFHECVHLKQYVKDELQIRMTPKVHRRWKGESIDDEIVAYMDLPWEAEAYEQQDILLEQWREENGFV